MTGGTPLRFGPFVKGLNTLSDPAAIEDDELVDLINMELDLDGSLVSRPPIKLEGTNAAFSGNVKIIGAGSFSGTVYVFGSTATDLYSYNYSTGIWTLIQAGIECYVAVQYDDKMWFVATPASATNSGSWVPSVYTAIAAMPRGYTAVIHKNRMYISRGILDTTATGSRVEFSKVTDPTMWAGSGGGNFDVNRGDGQSISRLIIHNDNLMIFKNESTYFFAFDSDPASGIIRKISGVIGAVNAYAVASYENQLYLYHRGNVYEVVNYDFNRINNRVPFTLDGTNGPFGIPLFVSVINERLVVRYYHNLYVYNLRTRTWSRWITSREFGPTVVIPKDSSGLAENLYIAGSAVNGDKSYYSIYPTYISTASETIACQVKTKNYDLQVGFRFKRLFWWGGDLSSVNSVSGSVAPIVYSFTVTWDQLAAYNWDQLGTWDSPLSNPVIVQTAVATNSIARRRFIKFPKSLRFRQAYFQLDMSTDGTPTTGPVRVFNIVGVISEKEHVVKQVS